MSLLASLTLVQSPLNVGGQISHCVVFGASCLNRIFATTHHDPSVLEMGNRDRLLGVFRNISNRSGKILKRMEAHLHKRKQTKIWQPSKMKSPLCTKVIVIAIKCILNTDRSVYRTNYRKICQVHLFIYP